MQTTRQLGAPADFEEFRCATPRKTAELDSYVLKFQYEEILHKFSHDPFCSNPNSISPILSSFCSRKC